MEPSGSSSSMRPPITASRMSSCAGKVSRISGVTGSRTMCVGSWLRDQTGTDVISLRSGSAQVADRGSAPTTMRFEIS